MKSRDTVVEYLAETIFRQAFADKGSFITSTGLRGFSMWEAGGDYNDILLDAIRETADFC